MESDSYCRDIEAHLCRRNGGHLVRVVGPAFEMVTGWAARGIPLKVALKGIDRYLDRLAAKGPRRRPIRVEFCEADVLDVFDEWRRAVGVGTAGGGGLPTDPPDAGRSEDEGAEGERGAGRRSAGSLRAHLDRVVTRFTSLIAQPGTSERLVRLAEQMVDELGREREASRTLRGEARSAFLLRLDFLDQELLRVAREDAGDASRATLRREAEEQLAGFRGRMPEEALSKAVDAAYDNLLRERMGLPVVKYT